MKETCLQCQKEMSFNLPSNFCSMACEKRHAKEGKRRNVAMEKLPVPKMEEILKRNGLVLKSAGYEHGVMRVELLKTKTNEVFVGNGSAFIPALVQAMEGQAQA